MTPLASNKVQLFTGWRDVPKDKPQAFHLKKTYLKFLRQGQNLFVIFENKVVQNLMLEKNVFVQKWGYKLYS